MPTRACTWSRSTTPGTRVCGRSASTTSGAGWCWPRTTAATPFLLLYVLPHDDAYGWAAKRLYTVNTATRALEVRNVVAIEQLTPALEQAAAGASTLLFADHPDKVLRQLGVDDQVLRAARTIIDKPQLQAFGALFPEDQFEVLRYLAEGFSPEEVYRDVVAERRPADAAGELTESLAVAIANTTSRITLVTRPDELAEILDKPFAAWRVFLHPSQRRVAYRVSYQGPAQVTGGPGTGKTVVALHRVKYLVSRSPDSRVLLTTYTNALAGTLRENLALLLDDDEARLARVEVTTVNALAHRTLRNLAGRVPSLIGDADERDVWRRVRRQLDLTWTEQFLAQEFRHVILAQRVGDLTAYQQVSRRGRGSVLGARQRERVWRAMEVFRAELSEHCLRPALSRHWRRTGRPRRGRHGPPPENDDPPGTRGTCPPTAAPRTRHLRRVGRRLSVQRRR
jgi:Cdc6-like AAA superfamily ATPase